MLLQHLLPNIDYSNLTLEFVKQMIIDESFILSNIVINDNNTNISFTSNKYIDGLAEYYFPGLFDQYELPIHCFKKWLQDKTNVRFNCFLTVNRSAV